MKAAAERRLGGPPPSFLFKNGEQASPITLCCYVVVTVLYVVLVRSQTSGTVAVFRL
jgi:hypothetical protein